MHPVAASSGDFVSAPVLCSATYPRLTGTVSESDPVPPEPTGVSSHLPSDEAAGV